MTVVYKVTGGVAQLVEQRPFKPWVVGSSPTALITYIVTVHGFLFLLAPAVKRGFFLSSPGRARHLLYEACMLYRNYGLPDEQA